jgi:hypothetical protein
MNDLNQAIKALQSAGFVAINPTTNNQEKTDV